MLSILRRVLVFKCSGSYFKSNVSKVITRQLTGRSREARARASVRNTVYYVLSLGVAAITLTFAAVPGYRILCEKTSLGGLAQVAKDTAKIADMKQVENRTIRVVFNSVVPPSMPWEFKPLQSEIYVHPGETALAFYTAYNPLDRPIVGISSYNLTPYEAAYYFTKIQCFCFEEQILNPKEKVDLPVFFYIDPDYANDPKVENMDSLLLSYTFFESNADLVLPSPFDPENQPENALAILNREDDQEAMKRKPKSRQRDMSRRVVPQKKRNHPPRIEGEQGK